jgi:hypothetical protein
MGRESRGRHSEPLNPDVKRVIEFVEKQTKEAINGNLFSDKIPEIYVKLTSKEIKSKTRRLKAKWSILEEPEEEPEYEDVYETLPESEEGSIQVGEGCGPRLIGKRNKKTGMMEVDLRHLLEENEENFLEKINKFTIVNHEKSFAKRLLPDIV